MDSKLEARIDEIFMDVPKSDKIVTMINRIKSKANAKYLEIRNNGYSRNVAFNEVDDWLMKAKVIVDEEAGKLTPAEIAALPKTVSTPGTVVSSASMDDGEAAVVVERDSAPIYTSPSVDMTYADNTAPTFGGFTPEEYPSEYPAEYPADYSGEAPAEEIPAEEVPAEEEKPAKKEKAAKKDKAAKQKNKKGKKAGKYDVGEDDAVVPPNKPSGKVGKIFGIISLVAGVALIIVAILMLLGII